MNPVDKKHSDILRSALLALHHSGHNGFEGLLGIVLGEVTGQSFRLAKSGSQRGRDGDSAFDGGATYFEGKRYKQSPKPAEITAKLFDLLSDDAGQVDLWVLGATCEIAAQTATDMRRVCESQGIGSVLLDWNENDLGPLLVAIAKTGQKAKDFISKNLNGKAKPALIKNARSAIDHFAKHPDLPARLESLHSALSAEEAGLGYARKRNREWMTSILSNRVSARAHFGQPLAPRDNSGLTAIARPIEGKLAGAFKGTPEAEIYAVIGEEGVGKSWLAASTWLASDPASVFLLIPAEDLLAPEVVSSFETYLIDKLVQQTGGRVSPRASERWSRRIKGWRANPRPHNVRVTMVIDGLNQSLRNDWSRRLDYAASELAKIGGCLVITTRTAHWKHLKNTLASKVAEVRVGQWTVAEVQAILRSRSIDSGEVKPDVLESLRNPRILGIAVDLLSKKDVETIEQLSVGRLMFEHMRKAQTTGAAPMSGAQFAELLKELANETLARAQRQQTDDLRLFEEKNHQGLQDAASCRFFEPVKGNLQYEIKNEGLNLGLALSLIDALEKELRNGRNPKDRLARILEPVSALDEAASVVFLAIQIACLDDEASPEVREALIEHFVSLQNLPISEAEAFAVLARTAASSFLAAAESVHTSSSHVPNADWLLYSLLKHRDHPQVWAEISTAVRRWLALYSLAPERMMFKSQGRDSDADVSEERAKRQDVLDKKSASLTGVERKYIKENLVETDYWRFETLQRLAFFLLAGKPLEGFACDLIKWSLSDALGPAIHAPDKEFRQLIRFNRVDWKETRAALIKELKVFEGDNSLAVGKWAIVEILRGTGAVEDAREAEDLAEWLTRDREKFEGWSRIEDYCAVDPCDPGTNKPDNVDETAKQYREIDASKLATHMGQGEQDHFFNMARAGVVRFHLDDAVVPHRGLADDFLKRTGFAKRQAALTLLEHSSALTQQQARDILKVGQETEAKLDKDNRDGRDEWLTAQYCIYAAIAHLTADEQLGAIAGINSNNVLLDILDALLPASKETTERVLERVLQSTDSNKQISALAAIGYSRPDLSPRSRAIIGEFLNSGDASVRTQALGAAAAGGDDTLLKLVVASGWDARPLRTGEQTFERWYGSSAILEAAKSGLIPLDEALDRMDLHHYGFAAQALGQAAAKEIAKRVEAALINAIGYTQGPDMPEMVTSTPDAASSSPPMISLSDPPPSQDIADRLDRLGETSEQFDARQDRLAQSFDRFTKDLTSADARLVLSDLTLGGMKALIEADEEAGKRWITILSSAKDAQLCHVHHVATQVAVSLPAGDNARKLLARLEAISPSINRVAGIAKVPAHSLALWGKADVPGIKEICKHRLITRRDDGQIALEVLAASLSGKSALVEETIDGLLASGQPADTCLALTLSGFCDESANASRVLARFEKAQGYIGIAHKAASGAYQRNLWARKWYEQMKGAKTALVFWRASVLFNKIVDGRFDIWSKDAGPETNVFRAFLPTVLRSIDRRAEKWQKKRKDYLFGDKSPADFFLPEVAFADSATD
ncbi:hypothetical protein [Rhodobium gokarnense]|uniref:NACHT domain-containing protein n=1 Tax=Rhodobium gokarnense TaxID=364296 RepID=A0ABT3HEY9_9HYPH|nr:hypothetical protein [Rhodobium gokarnense]MCW2308945.1 hypothetical protein [Rhodobium gokarnense]